MVSIQSAVTRVKADLGRWVGAAAIVQQCERAGHVWRQGPLDPAVTLGLFLVQVLHGNTAIQHLRHLASMTCSASAYCQARIRLPLAVIEAVGRSVTAALVGSSGDVGRWLGHRVWQIDGTGFSMPDTDALRDRFGQPSAQRVGCGFPVSKLLVLTDAATGFIAKTLALPLRTHEMAHAAVMHAALSANDVLVADRGFCSYVHLALVLQRHLHAVFRVHQKTIVSFKRGRPHAGQYPKHARTGLPTSKWLKALGPTDQLVQWVKPATCPSWCDAKTFGKLPGAITLRELRYRVDRPGFRTKDVTLVTTLLDADAYPKAELAERYRQRWDIEKRLRELKITLRMDVLRCKTPDGVLKELAVFTLVYNLVRAACLASAAERGVPPDRVSFTDAMRWLREPRPWVSLSELLVNPTRPDRIEPRVRKRRPKQYPLMQKPRSELKELLLR
jgi:hypothetical protein